MSEVGKLQPGHANLERAFADLTKHQIGRGPAQARVFNSGNQTTTTAVSLALVFDSEHYDTGDFHTNTNGTRLTAPTAGLYDIGGCAEFVANVTGQRQLFIRLNGATAIAVQRGNAAAAGVSVVQVSTQYQLDAGDFVELLALQTSGGNLVVNRTVGYSPEFWIVRLGSQA